MKRNTWQRDAVRYALRHSGSFVSAQALHADLRNNGSEIGLATVYRALNDLTSVGDVDTLQSPDGENLYRACETDHHHHHLVCRLCGRTVEISADPVETWATQEARAHGFSDAQHVVDIFGTCAECAAKQKS